MKECLNREIHRLLIHSLETYARMLGVGVENEKEHFIMQTNIYMTIHKKVETGAVLNNQMWLGLES